MLSRKLLFVLVELIMISLIGCAETKEIPAEPAVATSSLAGKWQGGSVFYDSQGYKRAFLVTFEVSSDEKQIKNLQVGYASRWPLDGSWDGRNSAKTVVEIHTHSFSITVIIPSPTSDPYKQDFLPIEFTGTFGSSGILTGTFVSTSTLGSGQWLATPENIWGWEHMKTK